MPSYNSLSWGRKSRKPNGDASSLAGSTSSKKSSHGRSFGHKIWNRFSLLSGIDIDAESDCGDASAAGPSHSDPLATLPAISVSAAQDGFAAAADVDNQCGSNEGDFTGSMMDEVNASVPSSLRTSVADPSGDQDRPEAGIDPNLAGHSTEDLGDSVMDEINASVPSSMYTSDAGPSRSAIELDRGTDDEYTGSMMDEVNDMSASMRHSTYSGSTYSTYRGASAAWESQDGSSVVEDVPANSVPQEAAENVQSGDTQDLHPALRSGFNVDDISEASVGVRRTDLARRNRVMRRIGLDVLREPVASVASETATAQALLISDMLHSQCSFPTENARFSLGVPNRGELDTSPEFYTPMPGCEELQTHTRGSLRRDSFQLRVDAINAIRRDAARARAALCQDELDDEAYIPKPCRLYGPPTLEQHQRQLASEIAAPSEVHPQEESATKWIDRKLESFNLKEFHSHFGKPRSGRLLHNRVRELQVTARKSIAVGPPGQTKVPSETLIWMSKLEANDRSSAAKLLEEARKIKGKLDRLEVRKAALINQAALETPFGSSQSKRVWDRMSSKQYWHVPTRAFANRKRGTDEVEADKWDEQNVNWEGDAVGLENAQGSTPADAGPLSGEAKRLCQSSSMPSMMNKAKTDRPEEFPKEAVHTEGSISANAGHLGDEVQQPLHPSSMPSPVSKPKGSFFEDQWMQAIDKRWFELSGNVAPAGAKSRPSSDPGASYGSRELRPSRQRTRRFRTKGPIIPSATGQSIWSPDVVYRFRKTDPLPSASTISMGDGNLKETSQNVQEPVSDKDLSILSIQTVQQTASRGEEPLFPPSLFPLPTDGEESPSGRDQHELEIAPLKIHKAEPASTVAELSRQGELSEKARGKLPLSLESSDPSTPRPNAIASDDMRIDSVQKGSYPMIKNMVQE